MKNITSKKSWFLLVLLFIAGVANAQNNWTFPMVFTIGSGVSDTLWFIQDDNATLDVDEEFGEGQFDINPDVFQVYFRLDNGMLSKVIAIPFTTNFTNILVRAINWDFPVTVSWDKELFDTIVGDYPPIMYASLENSYSAEHDLEGHLLWDYYGWFILGLETTGPQPPYDEHDEQNWSWFNTMYAGCYFPMEVNLLRQHNSIIENVGEFLSFDVYPNPAKDIVHIEFSPDVNCRAAEIYTMDGRLVETCHGASLQTTIDISSLNSGVYMLKLRMSDGKEWSERIVKE